MCMNDAIAQSVASRKILLAAIVVKIISVHMAGQMGQPYSKVKMKHLLDIARPEFQQKEGEVSERQFYKLDHNDAQNWYI